jgi:hypothetical protein
MVCCSGVSHPMFLTDSNFAPSAMLSELGSRLITKSALHVRLACRGKVNSRS